MNLRLKQNETDNDMVEVHSEKWLIAIVNIDFFSGESFYRRLDEEETINVRLTEVENG